MSSVPLLDLDETLLMPLLLNLRPFISDDDQVVDTDFIPLSDSAGFNSEDFEFLKKLILNFRLTERRPFASAPVRSKPRRTYDPSRPAPDPEGDYVPMYLANVYFQNKKTWATLKEHLEDFGKVAGLFDEITIKPLGRRDSEPFQVQVRKFDGRLKGPPRNLIDVGYGVSQVLPVINRTAAPGCAAHVSFTATGSASPPERSGRSGKFILPGRQCPERQLISRDAQRPFARPCADGYP